jgi:hypothetical protein
MRVAIKQFAVTIRGLKLAIAVTCAFYVNEEAFGRSPRILAEYAGYYVCLQGETSLKLQILDQADPSAPNVIFRFGPTESNPAVPSGAFLLNGIVDPNGGELNLTPVSWVSQPSGFIMVGLVGSSTDGGQTYSGRVVSGVGCSDFIVHRSFLLTNNVSPADIPPIVNSIKKLTKKEVRTTRSLPDHPSEITLQSRGGTLFVPVAINDALTLSFIVDSGASDVSIPADVVLTLIRTGTLREGDFLGRQTYRLADGSRVPSVTFRIRVLRIGTREIRDVIPTALSVDL